MGAADHQAIELAMAPRKVGPARPGERRLYFLPAEHGQECTAETLEFTADTATDQHIRPQIPRVVACFRLLPDSCREKPQRTLTCRHRVLPSLPPPPTQTASKHELDLGEKATIYRPSNIFQSTLLPILTVPKPPSSSLCPYLRDTNHDSNRFTYGLRVLLHLHTSLGGG